MQFNGRGRRFRIGEVSCQHGVVTWKVKNFSSLSQQVNCYYNSREFYFKDHRLFLTLYTNYACDDSSEGYVRLDLNLVFLNFPIDLRYSLGIQAADGKRQVWSVGTKKLGRFETTVCARGILRSELLLRREELLPQDVLTVTATLREVGADKEEGKHTVTDVSVETEDINESGVQDKSGREKGVIRDIEKLWVSGEYSDVILKVKDVEFKAHKIILAARTPVLGAMFQHDTAERASGEVTIDDCEPAVFEQLLHYIYTGSPRELNAENVVALYIVADKYLVSELKALCVWCMKKELCLDTFCDYAKLSLMFNERELLEMAEDFFSRNMIQVVKTVEWQKFSIEHSTWGNEIMIRALELTEARNGGNSS